MFTGLIEELGVLQSIRHGADSAQLNIAAKKIIKDVNIGDSIAVNGVCLTVTKFDTRGFTADVMAETLAKTNLGNLKSGDRVNLERALKLGDRLGGHLVSGHIDGVGTIVQKEVHDIAILITVNAQPEVMRYIIKKGSVAIDGTSLTVVDFNSESFRVSIIPHTAHETTLGFKKEGDTVNLEGDVIGKYIERLLQSREIPEEKNTRIKSSMSLDFLAKHGFV
ncbi:riboflavin synthase [Desulfolucanica intricata]|uniref:riboflavin synthase n=1 Tax=Desulfolucanica intricata TaxID=1285191 RepID=UPI000834C09F|nr:riboflavin synthase [Desulfolucanica intricata]